MTQAVADRQERRTWVPVDTFGARLALIRQAMGWNVTEAATACGVPPTSWKNWERGRQPHRMIHAAQAIADRTGCDRDWLVFGGPLESELPPPSSAGIGADRTGRSTHFHVTRPAMRVIPGGCTDGGNRVGDSAPLRAVPAATTLAPHAA